jgi:hypothetical protein
MKRNRLLSEEFINSISKNFTARNKTIWGQYNDIAVLYNKISDLKDFIERASDLGIYDNEQQERIESLRLTKIMNRFSMVAAPIECAAGQIQFDAKSFLLDRAFKEYSGASIGPASDAAYISALRTQINNLYTLMNHIRHDLELQLTPVTNIQKAES